MSENQTNKASVKADSIITAYIDPLPQVKKEESIREWYYELRSHMNNWVSVSMFNRVRFLSKFRQMEPEDEEDYSLFFAEMEKFNKLSEQLFLKRLPF